METVDEGITKRLSFGEVSQHLNATQQLPVEDVIKALKMPSVENLNTALQLLQDGYKNRFNTIEETAKEQSEAVGEADLRRMKRQFSSLKNTFLHYVVKDEFIAALADGLPNGTENVLLSQYDEDANRNIENLRAMKARNLSTQEEISSLISQINATLVDLNETNTKATSTVSQIQKEIEESEKSAAEIPELPPGLDEAQCQAALAEEAEKARRLEAAIVEQTAKASEIETILPSEREETDVLHALVADLSAQRAAYKDLETEQQQQPLMDATTARFAGTVAWADNVIAILQALGGAKVVSSTPGEPSPLNNAPTTALQIELSTSFPSIPVYGGSLGACSIGTHTLSLTLDNATGAVCSASLTPADIDASDIVEAAISGSRGPEFVLREVRSRVAGVLHRRALAHDAIVKYPGTMVDPSGVSITTPITHTTTSTTTDNTNTMMMVVSVQVVMDSSWPAETSDTSRIVRVSVTSNTTDGNTTADTTTTSSMNGNNNEVERVLSELNGKRFEGCGFVAALEAVEQKLSSL